MQISVDGNAFPEQGGGRALEDASLINCFSFDQLPQRAAGARYFKVILLTSPVRSDAEIETVITSLAHYPGDGIIAAPGSFMKATAGSSSRGSEARQYGRSRRARSRKGS